MAQTVIGIFNDYSAAQRAVERLTTLGVSRENIDLSYHGDSSSSRSSSSDSSFGSDTTSYASDSSRQPSDSSRYGSDSRSAEGDGLGDRISRFFSNLFDDEDDTRRYSSVASKGTVVSVHAQSMDEAERVSELLDECGAVDVDEHSRSYGVSGMNTLAPENSSDSTSLRSSTDLTDESDINRSYSSSDRDSDKSIPIIEEDLQVGKREVERGGMRLRSRIFERPVEENLRLREEHVRVERTPVNRPATDADFSTFREGEIEMRERSEVPVVNKEARVVEEVNLRKEVTERDEVVRDTVRRTDVEIESLNDDLSDLDKSSNRKNKI